MDKLTFNAYSVVHDHTIGSCTGRLRLNGYQITYVPSSDTKDGFVSRISDIVQVEPGDVLKIHLKNKTYKFHANGVKSSEDSRTKMADIGKQLSSLLSPPK
jgi:hypothetical protein